INTTFLATFLFNIFHFLFFYTEPPAHEKVVVIWAPGPTQQPPFWAAPSDCPPFCGPRFCSVYVPAAPHVLAPPVQVKTQVPMSAMQWLLPLLTVWPLMVTSRLISTV